MLGNSNPDQEIFYRITAAEAVSRNGQPYLKSLLRERTTRRPPVDPPSDAAIEAIEAVLATATNGALSERNLPILQLANEGGLRRIEIINMKRNDIPSWETIDQCFAEGTLYSLLLTVTKGGRERIVHLSASLMARIRIWMEVDRAEIVAAKIARGALSRDPEELFISSKTGKALTGQALTNLFKAAAKRAKHPTVRLHALRHAAITRQLKERLDLGMEENTAMLVGMELSGHATVDTYAQYVHLAKAQLKGPGVERALALAQDARVASDWTRATQQRLSEKAKWQRSLECAVDHLIAAVADGRISVDDILRLGRHDDAGTPLPSGPTLILTSHVATTK
jgi:integrase